MVDAMQVITATLALVALAGAIGVIAARVSLASLPAVGALGAAVVRLGMHLTAAIAIVATLGSLYFSERAGYLPCRWCWFQRVAMYPIAAIALVALLRRDTNGRWYVLPLATIGAAISTYHVLIEQGIVSETESCALFGPSCADVWFETFGFMTLAMMAWCGFVAIIVLNTVSFPSTSASVTSEESA